MSKSLFTLIFPQMLKELMKIAKDLEILDKLLDSSNISYRDSKSKKSGLAINFMLPCWYCIKFIVFLRHPVQYV